ncbi:DNA mismatch repair protein MutL [Punctularia strigosozonata HHB-11173 SS5]|uniref:DNA mismatch repair protein MutL n=1 Tax=Punctularia strigosozonata (strain HHB-11173) TaxID=741275 RepID=UPI0004416D17|nr:DNA mismatch repair protein MutL [Punctularia strigosozonata HHB-11173 SS5]EIN08836.1 DNA mismatch repair protein MutL [Punctularia strigosozonata HHB-11173 SS5]
MANTPTRPDSESPPPPGPKPIQRLHETLINRIAAGEIIQRPASALKELLENSLDAGSTSIKITVKDGGMKLLQIQDNGHGIRKTDLPILAERFTTSKLQTFSDLSGLTTYGFRGEALASVSHVAHLSVVTKTKEDSCAWKAYYSDGVLVPPKPNLTPDPKPCAGTDGTVITVENLFYNTPTRLAALRSSSEEYGRILDVVTRYAVHNPHVAFTCKKVGTSSPDVSTPSGSTTMGTIRLLYGHTVARELLHVPVAAPPKMPNAKKRKRLADETGAVASSKDKGKQRQTEPEDMVMDELEGGTEEQSRAAEEKGLGVEPATWTAEAYISSTNYHAKKTTFLLFINHRLVDSSRIRRALEGIYNGILPKGTCPWIYLSLQLDPRTVDVNVHPTKREVHFLDEEAITSRVADACSEMLVKKNESRTFTYQTTLSLAPSAAVGRKENSKTQEEQEDGVDEEDDEVDELDASQHPQPSSEPPPNLMSTGWLVISLITIASTAAKKKVASQHKIRTSMQDRTLDSMFSVAGPSQPPSTHLTKTRSQYHRGDEGDDAIDVDADQPPSTAPTPTATVHRRHEIKETECWLSSIAALRQAVQKDRHNLLTEILCAPVFVGIVDLDKCLSLIQHAKCLYLVNHAALAEELFYQLGLRQFGGYGRMRLEPAPDLRALIQIGIEVEDTSKSKLSKPELVERIADSIIARREMLGEYFAFNISADGHVETLPLLLRGYTPNLDRLPMFLMRLGPQVDWSDEMMCFDTFLRELAYFYTSEPLGPTAGPGTAENESPEMQAARWQIEHVLFPAMRYMVAPKKLLERDVLQVASLPELYHVFERC